MLSTAKLFAEFEAKADQFAGFQDAQGRRLAAYRAALAALGTRYPSAAAIAAAQRDLMAGESAGALPTSEYDTWQASRHAATNTTAASRAATHAGARTHGLHGAGQPPPVVPFGRSFAHHAESRAWAEGLRGVTTFAVDGSQLLPWRDVSVPVALVQAGLFENPHVPPAPYIKDITVELLTPDDLLGSPSVRSGPASTAATPDDLADEDARAATGQLASEEAVHLRRFQLEARTLVARMEHHARQRAAGRATDGNLVVGLLDGSLIVSFALKMSPPYRDAYIAAARSLLDASTRYRVPLVAYIDTSYARDIVGMLRRLALDENAQPTTPLPPPHGVHDALLWGESLAWGDRSPAFLSARGDLLAVGDGYGPHKDGIAFVYFQAALDRPPARLEFPRWIIDAGLLDRVLDAVRAEVIAGNGYPYPLESADAVAVISLADRAQFYRLFQQFAERRGLALSFSRKALSKSRRRA